MVVEIMDAGFVSWNERILDKRNNGFKIGKYVGQMSAPWTTLYICKGHMKKHYLQQNYVALYILSTNNSKLYGLIIQFLNFLTFIHIWPP